jgi:hypothetical protein
MVAAPGEQRNVEVALSDRNGGIGVYEDVAANEVVMFELSSRGVPGAAWPAHSGPLGGQQGGEIGRRIPYVWISDDGKTAVVTWSALGVANQVDGYAVRFVR